MEKQVELGMRNSRAKFYGVTVLITLTILIITSGCVELEPTQEGIEIRSDSDFETLNFPGSGTINDPYVIANFTLKKTQFGILIQDTTKHFVIKNCYIEQFYGGIYLRDFTTGTGKIINNTIINAYPDSRYMDPGERSGIGVSHSNNILIANNSIIDADDRGISISGSENITFSQNYLSGHHCSVSLSYSKNINILENSFSPTVESFYCYEISYVTIQDNYCKGGLRLYDCYNSTIKNNTITNAYDNSDWASGGHGIFASSSNCLYVDNHFENNEFYGIYLISSNYGSFTNNTLYHNLFLNNNMNGNRQAADDGQNNTWYNTEILQGNYWSDWNGTGSYSINGFANSYDLYPLSTENLSLILI